MFRSGLLVAGASNMDAAALAAAEAKALEDPSAVYDDVKLEDMEYVEDEDSYFYPCPCGDRFVISVDELFDGEDIARCPSCSLRIKVLYDPDDFIDEDGDEDDEGVEHEGGAAGGERQQGQSGADAPAPLPAAIVHR